MQISLFLHHTILQIPESRSALILIQACSDCTANVSACSFPCFPSRLLSRSYITDLSHRQNSCLCTDFPAFHLDPYPDPQIPILHFCRYGIFASVYPFPSLLINLSSQNLLARRFGHSNSAFPCFPNIPQFPIFPNTEHQDQAYLVF